MTSLDTNVLVRVLTDDDPAQVEAARELLASDDTFWVPVTVLLETAWVLEAIYELDVSTVADGLRHFLGLPNVEVDRPQRVALALQWYEDGLDVADAVHLAMSQSAERLATFDQAFVRDGSERGACAVVQVESI
jgi:predicted nucleic acid-binding protein